jgi:hypothetical protein
MERQKVWVCLFGMERHIMTLKCNFPGNSIAWIRSLRSGPSPTWFVSVNFFFARVFPPRLHVSRVLVRAHRIRGRLGRS